MRRFYPAFLGICERKTNVRWVWATGLGSLALLVALAWYLAPLHPGVMALQLSFTPGAFGAIIHTWSPADLERYRTHLPADYLLLLGYGSFGWLLARRTTVFAAYGPGGQRLARWLMPAAALCDAAENTLHAWLTEVPRFGLEPVYALAGTVSLAKWLMMMAFAGAVAHALWRQADE